MYENVDYNKSAVFRSVMSGSFSVEYQFPSRILPPKMMYKWRYNGRIFQENAVQNSYVVSGSISLPTGVK